MGCLRGWDLSVPAALCFGGGWHADVMQWFPCMVFCLDACRRFHCTSARHHPLMACCTTAPISTATTYVKRCVCPCFFTGRAVRPAVSPPPAPCVCCTVSSIILKLAFDFMLQAGARVVSASYGGSSSSQIEYDAIAELRQAGVLFVASAGNGRFPIFGLPCLGRRSPHHTPAHYLP